MAWALQPVVNVGLQILLSISLGWLLVRLRVLDAEKYMPQVNTLVLWVGVTSLSGYYLGLKLQLVDPEAWRQLAAYVLWIALTQLGILVYCVAAAVHWRRRRGRRRAGGREGERGSEGRGDEGEGEGGRGREARVAAAAAAGATAATEVAAAAPKRGSAQGGEATSRSALLQRRRRGPAEVKGVPVSDSDGDNTGGGGGGGSELLREFALLTLVLTANNCGMIGLPIMDATFGDPGRRLALLTGIPVMLWVVPFAIFAFEMHKVQREAAQQQRQRRCTVVLNKLGQPRTMPLPYDGDGGNGYPGGRGDGGGGGGDGTLPLRKAYSALPASGGGGGGGGGGGDGAGTAVVKAQRAWQQGSGAGATLLRRRNGVDAADVLLLPVSHRRSTEVSPVCDGGSGSGGGGGGDPAANPADAIATSPNTQLRTDRGTDSTVEMYGTAVHRGSPYKVVRPSVDKESSPGAGTGTSTPEAERLSLERDTKRSSNSEGRQGAHRDVDVGGTGEASVLPPSPSDGPPAPTDLTHPGAMLLGGALAAAAAAAAAAQPRPIVSPFAALAAAAATDGGGSAPAAPAPAPAPAPAASSPPPVTPPRRSGSLGAGRRGGGAAAAPLLSTVPSGDLETPPLRVAAAEAPASPASPLPAALSLASSASAALRSSDGGSGPLASGAGGGGGVPASSPLRRLMTPGRTQPVHPPKPPQPSTGPLDTAAGSDQHHDPGRHNMGSLEERFNGAAGASTTAGTAASAPPLPPLVRSASIRLEPRPSSTSLSAVDLPIPHRWLLGKEEEGLPAAAAAAEAEATDDAAAASGAAGEAAEGGCAAGDGRGPGAATAAAAAAADGSSGGAATAVRQLGAVLWTVAKNPLLWSLLLSLVVNLSGLRTYLDPSSPSFVEELGFIPELLHWFASVAIPVSLVSIGVWMYGKRLPASLLKKAGILLLLKVVALPLLQAGCALALGLPPGPTLTLVLLALCPTATTSFVIAAHFGYGTDVVSAVTLGGTVLLVPTILAALQLPRALGVELPLVAGTAAATAAAAVSSGGE